MEHIYYLSTLCIFLVASIVMLAGSLYHLFFLCENSRWKRQQLRLQAGILVLIILALCSYFTFYWFFRERGAGHVFSFVGLFSATIITQCGLAVYSLSDRRLITWTHVVSHYAMPVLMLVCHGLVLYLSTIDSRIDAMHNMLTLAIERAAWIYYFGYAAIIFFVSLRNSREFRQRLEDSYVTIDERQVLYRSKAIFFCCMILILFVGFLMSPSYISHGSYFIISTFGWGYFTYVIIRLKDSPLANTLEREEQNQGKEDGQTSEPTNAEMLFDSPVMQRLNAELDKVLIDSRLYLDPDLDINMLAQALCTNRTYIGRLFRMRGTTFSRYVNSMRLNHAEELLRTTGKSVMAICEECGFSDATFRRIFAERYNCSPMEYRKAML